MLPHTRPGGMAGLLEILVDQGGRADLHILADELSLEVDALLPTVDTAVLLGMLNLEEGDAIITPGGPGLRASATFRSAKPSFARPRSPMFRCLRQMQQALKAKVEPHSSRRILPGPARRTFQRRRSAPPAGNRHPVGTLRGTLRLRCRQRQADAHREPDLPVPLPRSSLQQPDSASSGAARPAGSRWAWAFPDRHRRISFLCSPPSSASTPSAVPGSGPSRSKPKFRRTRAALPLYALYSLVRILVAYALEPGLCARLRLCRGQIQARGDRS